MKILLTVHAFLPEHSAGTEVLTLETAKELQSRGHEVTVFAGHRFRGPLDDPDRFESYSFEGIEVERFRHDHVPMGGETNVVALEYNNPLFARHFRRHLEDRRPDIVHFFHLQRLSASAIDVCHELGIPTVLTATDFWLVCPTNQLLLPDHSSCPGPSDTAANCVKHIVELTQSAPRRWFARSLPMWALSAFIRILGTRSLPERGTFALIRALSERADFIRERSAKIGCILAPTRFMAETLARRGIEPARIRLRAFGLRYGEKSPGESSDPRLPLRIGFIGTLYEHKGAHILVKAVRSLPESQRVTLRIYGDTERFPKYVAEITRLAAGDPRIQFCGTFPRSEIEDVVSEMDVLVVPSVWHENTPLVILHAQAAGCPVVGSDVAGISEIIADGVNGLLFEPGNSAALATILSKLAEDRKLLADLASRAVQPKSIAAYVDELLEIYHELHGAGGG